MSRVVSCDSNPVYLAIFIYCTIVGVRKTTNSFFCLACARPWKSFPKNGMSPNSGILRMFLALGKNGMHLVVVMLRQDLEAAHHDRFPVPQSDDGRGLFDVKNRR